MSNLDKKYNLRLDLRINFTNSTMKFDEFDINTSDFFIKVTRNKELIDISEAIVTLVAIKPDGTVESQFVTITENNVYCNLKPSMKDIPGKYKAIASITINGETINTDPTNPIVYEVTENKFLRKLDAAVVSEERFSILTDMINKLSAIENQENDRIEAEKTREENAKKAITELNDIAKNFDNTVFEKVNEVIEPSLNEKLPSIVSNKIESIKEELKGEQGEKGDKGDKGDIGSRGETGPAGPQGERGIQGKTGATGQKGEQGLPGNDGQDGITPNIQIGTVTTLEPSQQATVVNVGTLENPIFDFGIPRGEDGAGSSDGENANIQLKKIREIIIPSLEEYKTDQSNITYQIDNEGNALGLQFNIDDNGQTFKLSEVFIYIEGSSSHPTNSLTPSIACEYKESGSLYGGTSFMTVGAIAKKGGKGYAIGKCMLLPNGMTFNSLSSFGGGNSGIMTPVKTSKNIDLSQRKITAIRIYFSNNASYGFCPGTKIFIFGR